MQKYFGTRIADLIPKINHQVFIPSIQRPYVWEPEQIIKLFDSLMRGYPINTFLLWELHPEHFGDCDIYRFVSNFRHGDIHNEAADFPLGQPATLVLDGQQRMTSLLIGLCGSYTVRNGVRGKGAGWVSKVLLLNLLESPEHDDDECDDGTIFRELYYGFRFAPTDRLPKNDTKAIWFKTTQILQITDKDLLGATIDKLLLLHPDLTDQQQWNLRRNLSRLWQVVHEEECLAYYLERDPSYDKVLDIFIRANDGGTKLSKSDLLMSLVTLRWERFNARSETEAVTYIMREVLEQDSAFDRDYLLRAGLFFNDLDFAFQLRNFTPRNIAIIESRWQEVKHALLLASAMFVRFCIKGSALTGVNGVMLIACYIFKLNKGKDITAWTVSTEDEERIRRWIVSVLFHGVLGGAANVTMELYRRVLNERLGKDSRFPVAELSSRMTTRGRVMTWGDESVGRFMAQELRSRISTICLTLLYDRTDWSTKDWQAVQIMPSHRLLDDRLRIQGVQQEEIPAYQSWASRLANHIILSDDEAREYYSMALEDWVATRTPNFFAHHMLPYDPALYDEFNLLDLIAVRRKLIQQRLLTLLQGDLTGNEFPETQVAAEALVVN